MSGGPEGPHYIHVKNALMVVPWTAYSNWTDEDRHAVVVYLRHLPPVKQQIPEPTADNVITVAGALEQDYGPKDYGVKAQ